jgi:hypothetical protein
LLFVVLDTSQNRTIKEVYTNYDEDLQLTSDSPIVSFGRKACIGMVLKSLPKALFESGTLQHEGFGFFQRFTLPYQLSPLSETGTKAQRVKMKKQPSGPRVVERLQHATYKKYQVVMRMNKAAESQQPSPINSISLRTKTNFYERRITMLCSSTHKMLQKYSIYSMLFVSKGWSCAPKLYTNEMEDFEWVEDCDCILVDGGIEGTEGRSMRTLITQLTVYEYTNPLVLLTDESTDKAALESSQRACLRWFDSIYQSPISNNVPYLLADLCDEYLINRLLD